MTPISNLQLALEKASNTKIKMFATKDANILNLRIPDHLGGYLQLPFGPVNPVVYQHTDHEIWLVLPAFWNVRIAMVIYLSFDHAVQWEGPYLVKKLKAPKPEVAPADEIQRELRQDTSLNYLLKRYHHPDFLTSGEEE